MTNHKYIAIAYIVLAVVLVGLARTAQDEALKYLNNQVMKSVDMSAIEIPKNASREEIINTYREAIKKQVHPRLTYQLWIVVIIKYILQVFAIYFCASMLVRKLKHVLINT